MSLEQILSKGGNGSTTSEEKANVSTPKGAREYLQSILDEKRRQDEAVSVMRDAIKRDVDLIARVLPQHSFKDGRWTRDDLLRELFPDEISCAENNARVKGRRETALRALGIGALVTAYTALVSNLAGRAKGFEAGKKARPVSSVAAEKAIEWLVGRL